VERDHLIETFKPKDYFTLQVEFITLQQEKFWTTWENAATTLDENGYCVDRRIVECIIAKIKGQSAQVIQFEEKEKQEAPPIGLSLSTLQKIASSQLGLSAKQVLETAQSLYETHKATTYPRSDCQYLPESQWNEAKIIVPALKHIYPELQHMIDQCDLTLKSAIWNDKKITAHHAIIPTTNSRVNYSQFSTVERQVYDLICRYYLAQFLKPYLYASRVVLIECKNEKFSAACHTPIALGWCQAFTDNENKVLPQDVKIPTLSPGMSLMSGQERLNKRQTQPLARHTEGTLIDAMQNVCRAVADPQLKKVLKETAGIGTEATRANILEILFKRGYLIRQGKLVVSTPKGRHLIASLPQIMTDPVTTAQWEQEFDAIANNQRTLDSFISQQTNILQNLLRVLINHPH
jgi:DNA topoisomerase-3